MIHCSPKESLLAVVVRSRSSQGVRLRLATHLQIVIEVASDRDGRVAQGERRWGDLVLVRGLVVDVVAHGRSGGRRIGRS